ncbi:TetR family transcriptional regulator, partial [Acinetobacter baumannii]|nr:TetR family transcriptional regulator [Acinetobacter baumannii]
ERSFASLSLREVAREAGIAPTSFYRHFRDVDELGLTMVDESGLMLRQLMRQARREYPQLDGIFCTNDDLAVGAAFECQRLGLKIPDDM